MPAKTNTEVVSISDPDSSIEVEISSTNSNFHHLLIRTDTNTIFIRENDLRSFMAIMAEVTEEIEDRFL